MSNADPEVPTPRRHRLDAEGRRFSSEPPATSRRRLTQLLSRWADARRLDPGTAESIRLAARAAPVDLGFDWWWRLLDPENGTAFRGAAARSTYAGAPPPTVEPPFAEGIPGLTTWPQDDAEYQPYLRLA